MIGAMAPGSKMIFGPGDRIGDYEVLAPLGAGGMGSVYKVRHAISQRIEALKVILPNTSTPPEMAERFLREIRLQASLEHPHIAALHNAFRFHDELVMVMEFVDGVSLRDKLRSPESRWDRPWNTQRKCWGRWFMRTGMGWFIAISSHRT